MYKVCGGEQRRIELLPQLFGSADRKLAGADLGLHSVGSTGERQFVWDLLSACCAASSSAGNAKAADRPDRLSSLRLDQRSERIYSGVGHHSERSRLSACLVLFALVPVGERTEQVPELRPRVQVIRAHQKKAATPAAAFLFQFVTG